QAGTRLVTSNDPSPSMESAIPVSLATARTDADAAVVQHWKATRNETANAMDLTVSIFPLKSHVWGQLASRWPGSRAPPASFVQPRHERRRLRSEFLSTEGMRAAEFVVGARIGASFEPTMSRGFGPPLTRLTAPSDRLKLSSVICKKGGRRRLGGR